MRNRITKVTNSRSIVDLIRNLRLFHKVQCAHQSGNKPTGESQSDCRAATGVARAALRTPNALNIGRTRRRDGTGNRVSVCVYNVKIGSNGPVLSTGFPNNRRSNIERCLDPIVSMYIGFGGLFYFIKRRLVWRHDGYTAGRVTRNFLQFLFGPTISKVVYNDALDLSNLLRSYMNLHLSNILDLGYLHTAQEEHATVTNSLLMLEKAKLINATDVEYDNFSGYMGRTHMWTVMHLSLAEELTQYLLEKQGHPEQSWRERIGKTIEDFISHKYKVYTTELRYSAIEPGHFTPKAFKAHMETTIGKLLGKDDMRIKIPEGEILLGSVKQKSFKDKTVLLTLNAFVLDVLSRTLQPIYAMVSQDAFHQFEDLGIGDTVEVVPSRNERSEVCLINVYDRVCCRATRLHGDALLYNLRTRKLVPMVTRHH